MAKSKTALFSFQAHGSLAKQLTYQDRHKATMIRRKPTPVDAKTLAQTYHRWLYQDYAALWHSLSAATQLQYESDARRRRITGFNLFMSTMLATLPDIGGAWHLDERAGITAIDFSKNLNHGTIIGALHTPGYIDYALDFDGIDDTTLVGTDASLNPLDAITIEATVYPHNLAGHAQGYIVIRASTYMIYNKADGKLGIGIYDSGDNLQRFDTDTILLDDHWYHVVMTWAETDGIIRAYINGQLDPNTTNSADMKETTQPCKIGGWGSTAPYSFEGLIDEVSIKNRRLAQLEITRHYERRYPE